MCAFFLTSLVAQRDAGIGRWTLRAAASSCVLVAWAAAAGSAAAFPGMAAFRVPACWMIRGWCPSPTRDPDRGHRRHPDRPAGVPPPALSVILTVISFHRQDDGPRAACTAAGSISTMATEKNLSAVEGVLAT